MPCILEVANQLVSRPVGSHHQPLAERWVRLSPHTAPIRQTRRSFKRLVCRIHRRHPVSSCFAECDHLARPLRSTAITAPSSRLRGGPPQLPASVLSPHGFGRLSFSLGIRKLDPAVPRGSLCPTHAPYTPAAIRTVIRLPADLSQRKKAPLILTTFNTLTTRHRRVCFRSSFGHSPAPGHA